MTTPTFERAARAARDANAWDYSDDADYNAKLYEAIARAVLMAVREPDEAVRDTGEGAFASALHKGGSLTDATLSIHQAMIDAILAQDDGKK